MSISDGDYNQARKDLKAAGSKSAGKSHAKHTGGKGSPPEHGQSLVDEATAEFQKMDKKEKDLTRANMTQAHLDAINKAKQKLGLK